MLSSSAITYERVERVAILRLNRPEAGNTLNTEVLEDLREQVRTIAASTEIRAVVLIGVGANFSLGGDFGEFAEALTGDETFGRTYCASRTSALAEVVAGLYDLPMPVLAAVNGQAAGAGFSLALACDLRLAEKRTRFHFAYGALGASTDGGMSWLLPRIVGYGAAIKLLYEQPVIRANHALDLGMVSDIVPTDELGDHAISLALHLAKNASHSNRTAKRLLRVAEFASLRDHMRVEHEAFADGLMSADMRRALSARASGEASRFV